MVIGILALGSSANGMNCKTHPKMCKYSPITYWFNIDDWCGLQDKVLKIHMNVVQARSDVQSLEKRELLVLLDVRTPEERAIAAIPGAVLLNEEEAARIESMPRDTKLVLHCHHGGRSQQAAEQFVSLGFSQVFNVIGGVDAWSQEIDPDVPRY